MDKKSLDDSTRRAILSQLLKASMDGGLPHGVKASVATMFKVDRHTVERIWRRYEEAVAAGDLSGDVSSRYKGNSGRKGYDRAALIEMIKAMPPEQRTNYRQTAASLGLSVGLIFNTMASKEMVVRTTTIKPVLRAANRERRMQWALSFVDNQPRLHGDTIGHAFDPFLHVVHIDEKWFNHDSRTRRYFMLPDETPPERHLQSARHIQKTMFLAVVARPR